MKKQFLIFLTLILLYSVNTYSQQAKHTFTMGDDAFMLDGKPFQMISGEMHYPRVPREAWRARMKMAKAMGLNTIGTYVFWNLHEPQKGHFDFSGNNDVAEFVKIAKEEGLWVILRPSPYVCAEWEFGGYPYWLQNEKGLVVRSMEAQYIAEYRKYINEVGKQLAPLQINHGGNILMVQIENEYGSYGSDKAYLALNQQLFKAAGFDGLLYTCDPGADVKNGHLPGLMPAINGVDDPAKVKKIINENHNGKGPYYIAEWYPAWFDWWGASHHTVAAEKYVGRLDTVLAAGISINMYMFHGGTTRAFMNGANYKDETPYEPQITSYDYDAPLDEAGNATDKFMKFRQVIQKHLPAGQTLPAVPAAKPAMAIPAIGFSQSVSVVDNLPKARLSDSPLTFEDLNQDYGYVLYRTTIQGGKTGVLKLSDLRDYAVIMVNGKTIGTLDRRLKQDSMTVTLPAGPVILDILVENMGRINFGKYLLENKKGITKAVFFNGAEINKWQMFGLSLSDSKQIAFKAGVAAGGNLPTFKKGTFNLQKIADTYIDLSKWGKGVVWVNGHNLGRYWNIGPEQTLYLPAEWLKKGANEIIVFELLKPESSNLSAIEKPILDVIQR
ncbi:glycoside hydrolase family 35 protein [Mucilaginibacter paludis]|uniref:Glycoside hydrolase family 35 n=1 Tax=Mucilaginibacter paludis DSM 18603 TaxID=714943 RepID=H1Y8J1_9SPHI|nr:beta-galactosidase family protein [Mucilaginibacter paludis]EHQ25909.1 glycoside hydrolase family 35 [Mucilaginibacter paludis DSM 18603]